MERREESVTASAFFFFTAASSTPAVAQGRSLPEGRRKRRITRVFLDTRAGETVGWACAGKHFTPLRSFAHCDEALHAARLPPVKQDQPKMK